MKIVRVCKNIYPISMNKNQFLYPVKLLKSEQITKETCVLICIIDLI